MPASEMEPATTPSQTPRIIGRAPRPEGLRGDAVADEEEGDGEAQLAKMRQPVIREMQLGHIALHNRGKNEEQDEPGQLHPALALPDCGNTNRDRNDPEGTGELDGGSDGESDGSVFRGGSDDGAGVVNGQCGPKPELRLREMQQPANRRKQK